MFGTSHTLGGPSATPRRLGLPVAVVFLRKGGERISIEEFKTAERFVGRLLLSPTNRYQTGGGASHMADLTKPGTLEYGSVCAPLFNPVVEMVDSRGFVLSGYEVQSDGASVRKVEQVWLVRPLSVADPTDHAPTNQVDAR